MRTRLLVLISALWIFTGDVSQAGERIPLFRTATLELRSGQIRSVTNVWTDPTRRILYLKWHGKTMYCPYSNAKTIRTWHGRFTYNSTTRLFDFHPSSQYLAHYAARMSRSRNQTASVHRSSSGSSQSSSWESRRSAAVWKIVIAAGLHFLSRGETRDPIHAILQFGGRGLRDIVIRDAIDDVFPHLSLSQTRLTQGIISLALDGQLGLAGISREVAKELLLERLTQADPRFASMGSLADFVFDIYTQSRDK